MKKLLFLPVFLFGLINGINAQFNDYKYIVVPIKFATFKNQNEHQTSTLVKYHIAKNGFNVVYDNAMPDELKKNRCLGLFVELVDNSSLFTTKAFLEFTKCDGTAVFTTKEGRTKIKEFKGAYAAVVEQAASSLKGKEHNYVEKAQEEEVVNTPVATPTAVGTVVKTPEKTVEEVNDGKEPAAVVETAVATTAMPKEVAEAVTVSKPAAPKPSDTKPSKDGLLYAQPTATGYQLVDTTPAVKYVLEATSVDTIFLVNQEDINGVVLQKDGKWFLEYKGPNGKVSKELQIKF